MLQAIERYMKQAIVDKVPSVSSSALVSSLVRQGTVSHFSYTFKDSPDMLWFHNVEIHLSYHWGNVVLSLCVCSTW